MGTIASVVLSSSCYEVLSFKTSPWAGFGQILDVACATTERHSCPVSTFFLFLLEGFPRQTCINRVGLKHGCKLMDQI